VFTSQCLFLNSFWSVRGWGEVFFVLFFEGSWKHAVHHPQPSKKDGHIYTAPNLPNKKGVIIHPTTLKKQKKTCSHPTTLKKQKKLVPTPQCFKTPKR